MKTAKFGKLAAARRHVGRYNSIKTDISGETTPESLPIVRPVTLIRPPKLEERLSAKADIRNELFVLHVRGYCQ